MLSLREGAQLRHRTTSSDSSRSFDYSQGGGGSQAGSMRRISGSSSRHDGGAGCPDARVRIACIAPLTSPCRPSSLAQTCGSTPRKLSETQGLCPFF